MVQRRWWCDARVCVRARVCAQAADMHNAAARKAGLCSWGEGTARTQAYQACIGVPQPDRGWTPARTPVKRGGPNHDGHQREAAAAHDMHDEGQVQLHAVLRLRWVRGGGLGLRCWAGGVGLARAAVRGRVNRTLHKQAAPGCCCSSQRLHRGASAEHHEARKTEVACLVYAQLHGLELPRGQQLCIHLLVNRG